MSKLGIVDAPKEKSREPNDEANGPIVRRLITLVNEQEHDHDTHSRFNPLDNAML